MGAQPDAARAAMIMVHGRNAGPANILDLVPVLKRPDFHYVAPAASGGTWYPFSFMAARERNEPGISSGLAVIESLVTDLMTQGFAPHQIMLLGFSQLAGQALYLEDLFSFFEIEPEIRSPANPRTHSPPHVH